MRTSRQLEREDNTGGSLLLAGSATNVAKIVSRAEGVIGRRWSPRWDGWSLLLLLLL